MSATARILLANAANDAGMLVGDYARGCFAASAMMLSSLANSLPDKEADAVLAMAESLDFLATAPSVVVAGSPFGVRLGVEVKG